MPSARQVKEGEEVVGVGDGDEGAVVEIEGDDEDVIAEGLERLQLSDERKRQIEGLRAKSLLRRAKANSGQGGWAQLAAAETGMSSSC